MPNPCPVVYMTAWAISKLALFRRWRISRHTPVRPSTPSFCQAGIACVAAVSRASISHIAYCTPISTP